MLTRTWPYPSMWEPPGRLIESLNERPLLYQAPSHLTGLLSFSLWSCWLQAQRVLERVSEAKKGQTGKLHVNESQCTSFAQKSGTKKIFLWGKCPIKKNDQQLLMNWDDPKQMPVFSSTPYPTIQLTLPLRAFNQAVRTSLLIGISGYYMLEEKAWTGQMPTNKRVNKYIINILAFFYHSCTFNK